MKKLYCDLETYSPVPIKNGTHAYAEKAEVLLWAYAVDDGPVRCWDVASGEPMPCELDDGIEDPQTVLIGHNWGMFDSVILDHAMPVIAAKLPMERVYDTVVQALSHSLPGALAKLCEIFKLSESDSKKKTGRQLIQLFCILPAKNAKRGRGTAQTHPKQWAEFIEYAKADITSMRILHKKMPQVNYRIDGGDELELWRLDQTINKRGFLVDTDLAESAVRAMAREQKALAKRTQELTNDEVSKATRRDEMLRHVLSEYGIDMPDMQKATLKAAIDDTNLPSVLRELLSVRLQSCSTSTAKYQTLLKAVSADGRLRGTLQFCGASRTGRWGGRLFQPQNLPSRTKLKEHEVDAGIAMLKSDCLDLMTDNVSEVVSAAIRGCIIAPAGKKLVIADLANIEGRMLAWLAREEWKLQAFRDGHDLYVLAYAKAFKVKPEEVTSAQRQVGKVMELALGYGGGVGAFLTFALAYSIDLEELADKAYTTLPPGLKKEAEKFYERSLETKRSTFGLSEKAFVTCDTFKRAWREAHPNVVALWAGMEAIVNRANLKCTFRHHDIIAKREGAWLYVQLPSGRCLCYPAPQVDAKGEITYMGIDAFSHQWGRVKTYGGKLVENITQAASRDAMAANMQRVEDAGYELVLSVHDELITEAPDRPGFNAGHLSSLMSVVPDWAAGLPLAAKGFESYRYRK